MGNIQKYPLQSADLPLSPPEQYHNGTCLWIHGWKQMHPNRRAASLPLLPAFPAVALAELYLCIQPGKRGIKCSQKQRSALITDKTETVNIFSYRQHSVPDNGNISVNIRKKKKKKFYSRIFCYLFHRILSATHQKDLLGDKP